MAEQTKNKKNAIDLLVEKIQTGDRVVWIVVTLLIMFSLVCIFSSTSMLAQARGVSRTDIFFDHFKIVMLGGIILLSCSAMPDIRIYRLLSKFGFILSLILLIVLDLHINIEGLIRVRPINGAYRSITVGGFNIQVFEVVKVAMVMYLAWAVQAYESGKFPLAIRLGTRYPDTFGWLKSSNAQKWVYILGPTLLVIFLILPGSTGSALLTAIVLFATILIGGVKRFDIVKACLVVGICGACALGLHFASGGTILPRLSTAISRIEGKREIVDKSAIRSGSPEFYKYLDKHRQPDGAEIAMVEGGRRIIGKGPGKSTQKYAVAVMFEDYMYSFIMEEYGLVGGLLVLILYLSLFARGTIIVQNCKNRFAKACVGGLVFLITFQALFHIIVNCNISVVTGQTLPLISHGRCSFLCFCFAFGVILSVSTIANSSIRRQQKEEKKLMERDEISVSMEVIDSIDDIIEQGPESLDDEDNTEKYESDN